MFLHSDKVPELAIFTAEFANFINILKHVDLYQYFIAEEIITFDQLDVITSARNPKENF